MEKDVLRWQSVSVCSIGTESSFEQPGMQIREQSAGAADLSVEERCT